MQYRFTKEFDVFNGMTVQSTHIQICNPHKKTYCLILKGTRFFLLGVPRRNITVLSRALTHNVVRFV